MSLEQILTLIVAIYGATVATILAVREIRKDKRRVLVVLEYLVLYEQAQIVIANVGHRPITITGVAMRTYPEQGGDRMSEMVPANALFDPSVEKEPFPATIEDGEHLKLLLSEPLSSILRDNKMKAEVTVYDVEGREHKEFNTRFHNPKWGVYYDS